MIVVVVLLVALGLLALLAMFALVCIALDKRRRRVEPEDAFDVAAAAVHNIQAEAQRAIEEMRQITEPGADGSPQRSHR